MIEFGTFLSPRLKGPTRLPAYRGWEAIDPEDRTENPSTPWKRPTWNLKNHRVIEEKLVFLAGQCHRGPCVCFFCWVSSATRESSLRHHPVHSSCVFSLICATLSRCVAYPAKLRRPLQLFRTEERPCSAKCKGWHIGPSLAQHLDGCHLLGIMTQSRVLFQRGSSAGVDDLDLKFAAARPTPFPW